MLQHSSLPVHMAPAPRRESIILRLALSGRNYTTYRRRVALDVVFARTLDVKLYLGLLIRTLPAALLSRGSD
jgi:hypothetical protein